MCDSFQTVWHKALQSALQMVLLFTLSAFFLLVSHFSFIKCSGSVFFWRTKEEIHQICSGATYLWAHKLYMPQSSRKYRPNRVYPPGFLLG